MIGDMVVIMGILLGMAFLNSGDNLLPMLKGLRSSLPCEEPSAGVGAAGRGAHATGAVAVDWRHAYKEVRAEMDSIINHVATTPLGFSILGIQISYNLVQLAAAGCATYVSNTIT
jgi:hypothetical protein